MVRQRTTVQFDSLNAIDTDNLLLDEFQVKIPARLYKNRQDKLTFKKEELPSDLQELLSDFYIVRLQWASPLSQRDELFQNFEIDGLSINLIPGVAQYEPVFDKFGEYIKQNFNIGFQNTTLVSLPTAASFHSYEQLKSSIIDRFLRKLVPEGLDRISFLTSFELSYQNQELSIQWISSPFDLQIEKSSNVRKEVALVQSKKFDKDIEVSGIRIVLSDEDSLPPTKTLFFVKNRHNTLDHELQYSLEQPIGLHPTLKISNFNATKPPVDESCELFLYNTISSDLFFDAYQYNKESLRLINSWGESDLEAPIWKTEQYGSVQFFQLNYETLLQNNEVELKFHSRYLKPSQSNQYELITPEIFWACDSSKFIEDFEEIRNNPFDNFGLGYESLFEDNTNFYHFNKDNRVLEYHIPTADIKDFKLVQLSTLIAVIVGVIYIVFKLFKTTSKSLETSKEKKSK